jgi:exonuclease III
MKLITQIESNTVLLGDLNIPLLTIDKSAKQNFSKENSELLHPLDQIDMDEIYTVFHPTNQQYTFFSGAHETYPK